MSGGPGTIEVQARATTTVFSPVIEFASQDDRCMTNFRIKYTSCVSIIIIRDENLGGKILKYYTNIFIKATRVKFRIQDVEF